MKQYRENANKSDLDIRKRLAVIYTDPKRHKFFSESEAVAEFPDLLTDSKCKGRPDVCYFCGGLEKGHAEVTEKI